MRGKSTLATKPHTQHDDPRIVAARIGRVSGEPMLVVSLMDGRVLGLPLWLYPTLLQASPSQRRAIELIAGGRGLRWPSLDLDLSARSMLAGMPDMTRAARAIAAKLHLAPFLRAFSVATAGRKAG